jgi:hypothetical protein
MINALLAVAFIAVLAWAIFGGDGWSTPDGPPPPDRDL